MSSEVDRCNKEDMEFLKELITGFGPTIVWKARKSANYSDAAAEEVLQEAMVRLVNHVSKLKEMDRKAQYGYVEQTIKNTANNYFHRRNLEQQLFEQELDFEEETRTIRDMALLPEDEVEHKLYVESRLKAFHKLPKLEQEIMLRKYFLGVSDQELAKQLNCKPASVRMMLTRIRRKALSYIEEGEKDDQ